MKTDTKYFFKLHQFVKMFRENVITSFNRIVIFTLG